MRVIPAAIKTLLKSKSMIGTNAPQVSIYLPDSGNLVVPAISCTINREEAADAATAIFSVNNVNPSDSTDTGYYTPYRSTDFGKSVNSFQNALLPSKRIQIEMGYAAEAEIVFCGEIDEATFVATPRDYKIDLSCRDYACKLIDVDVHTIWGVGDKEYTLEYPLPAGMEDEAGNPYYPYLAADAICDISEYIKDICVRAGFVKGNVLVEETGITDYAPVFTKMKYMDAINHLCGVVGFVFFVDEDGNAIFKNQTAASPEKYDDTIVLTGTAYTALVNAHIVSGSERVWSAAGETGIKYSRTTDYEIDLAVGQIKRRGGSTIGSGATVYVTYIYAAWVFQEGSDIYSLNLTVSRRNLYGTIRVNGNGVEALAVATSPQWDSSTIRLDKTLFADSPYSETVPQCQAAADYLMSDMLNHYICCDFAAVGNPWIMLGDSIMIIESSSTISEVYKITGLTLEITPDGCVMSIKAFNIGYTPL